MVLSESSVSAFGCGLTQCHHAMLNVHTAHPGQRAGQRHGSIQAKEGLVECALHVLEKVCAIRRPPFW
jgi:hypothetical protein